MIAPGRSLRGLSDVTHTRSARRASISPMTGRLPPSPPPPPPHTTPTPPPANARAAASPPPAWPVAAGRHPGPPPAPPAARQVQHVVLTDRRRAHLDAPAGCVHGHPDARQGRRVLAGTPRGGPAEPERDGRQVEPR